MGRLGTGRVKWEDIPAGRRQHGREREHRQLKSREEFMQNPQGLAESQLSGSSLKTHTQLFWGFSENFHQSSKHFS